MRKYLKASWHLDGEQYLDSSSSRMRRRCWSHGLLHGQECSIEGRTMMKMEYCLSDDVPLARFAMTVPSQSGLSDRDSKVDNDGTSMRGHQRQKYLLCWPPDFCPPQFGLATGTTIHKSASNLQEPVWRDVRPAGHDHVIPRLVGRGPCTKY